MSEDNIFYRLVNNEVEIEHAKFIKYINSLGIWLYYPDEKNYTYVLIEDNIVQEFNIQRIKQRVLADLNLRLIDHKALIIEKIHRSINVLFSPKLLETLPVVNMEFLEDDPNSAFFYFKNIYIQIKDRKIIPNAYHYLPKLIWRSSIMSRNYYDFEKVPDFENSVFEKFINNVCGSNQAKKSSISSIMGYLIHNYKNPAKPKAIILSDQKAKSNSGTPEGGTGKSLIINAIKQYKKTTKEDGKLFSTNTNFIFQQVDIDTRLLWFDDVSPKFNLLNLFSVISEGIQIEKKFQPKFSIPYNKSPKIVITSNYILLGAGESYDRRRIEFFLEPYYNADYTPEDEFGHIFFYNWDKNEWARFDLFMFNCVNLFLENGIIEYHEPDLEENKLAIETSNDFITFMKSQNHLDIELNAKDLHQSFLDFPGYNNHNIKANLFSRWLKKYTLYQGLILKQRYSNGQKYITITKIVI
jgi:hypothetical protein